MSEGGRFAAPPEQAPRECLVGLPGHLHDWSVAVQPVQLPRPPTFDKAFERGGMAGVLDFFIERSGHSTSMKLHVGVAACG